MTSRSIGLNLIEYVRNKLKVHVRDRIGQIADVNQLANILRENGKEVHEDLFKFKLLARSSNEEMLIPIRANLEVSVCIINRRYHFC